MNYNSYNFSYDNGLNISILNKFISSIGITLPNDTFNFWSFTYESNITVPNRPYNKFIWKSIFSDPFLKYPKFDLSICYNIDLFSGYLEILSKARNILIIAKP